VNYGGSDLPKQAKTPQKLGEAQIAELRRMLDQSGFSRLLLAGGQQPPDSYAYEIVAQTDAKSNYVEVFDGKIPESLIPLIQRLAKLLP
jgi:2-iminoacetate synthase ThiH